MTTLLAMTAMFGAVRSNVPRVSYVSFLDVWMCACIIFIFISLLEFTVIAWLIRQKNRPRAEMVERFSRIVFPIGVSVFNLVYWILAFW